MTFADRMRDHQGRCQPHLLRLRILARGEAGTACPSQVTAEVRDATNAIIAEAEAAGRASLAAFCTGHPSNAENQGNPASGPATPVPGEASRRSTRTPPTS